MLECIGGSLGLLESKQNLFWKKKKLILQVYVLLKSKIEPWNFSSEISEAAQNKYNFFDK